MSFYNNVGSMREGEMFLSEDRKVLQIVRNGELSIIEPHDNAEDKYTLGIRGLWNIHTDSINGITYVWDYKNKLWYKSHNMNTASQVYSDFSSLYPSIFKHEDNFGNIIF